MVPLRHLQRGFAASVLVLSVALLAGCGSPRVEGKVTFDGQPVDGGTITFFPDASGAGHPNVPGQIVDGKYVLDSPTLESGKYRVEIYWFKKTGRQIPSGDPPNKVDETIQVIPKKYNVDSKTTVEIKSGTNTFNYDLTSK
jgi:hypothetical protein